MTEVTTASGGGARVGTDGEIVKRILALRFRLLGNMFKRPTIQVVGIVLGGLYALGFGGAALVAIGALRLLEHETAGVFSTAIASLLVLGFALAPLLFGIEDPLDPRTIMPFGIPERPLSIALVVAAAVGPAGIALLAVCVALFITTTFTAFGGILGLVGTLVLFATCTLAMRVSASFGAWALSGRTSKLVLSVVGFVLIIGGPLAVVFLMQSFGDELLELASSVTSVTAWTPLGATFGAAAAANDGDLGGALLKFLVSLATLAALWFGWRGLVGTLLTSGNRTSSVGSRRGLGIFAIAPSSTVSAVAARSFVYFVRDGRYLVSVIAIIAMPLLIAIPFSISGMPREIGLLVPPIVFAVFLGWAPHNDVAYDNTAVWQHIVSGVPGWADRLGRLVPYLLFGVPLMIVVNVIFVGVYGHWDDWTVLPPTLGLSFAIAGGGFGLSSVSSAALPYPVVKPGESPFKTPQGSNAIGGIVQMVVLFGSVILAIPVALLALPAMFGGELSTGALWLGIGMFVVLTALGVWVGGHVFVRRRSQILAAAMQN